MTTKPSKPPKPVTAPPINKENWQEKKSKLKEKFPNLSDSDISIKN